jgi:Ser-tRNA(Ala) deacylase AlaX
MAWRCQVEPYLRNISTSVRKCEPGEYKLKNQKLKGWKVELEETVFFPEGGGQPGDAGKINSTNVIYTYREGEKAIHFCEDKIETGVTAEIAIDWDRRFDHMQQHTGKYTTTI